MEHASVAAFARFVLQLMSVGAPPDLITDAQRAIADETEHAKLCFSLVAAYSSECAQPGALRVEGAMDDCTPDGILAAVIREGCLGETFAAAEAAEARTHAASPALRDILNTIHEDETRHAGLAWRTVQWVIESGLCSRERVRTEFAKAIAEARAALLPVGARDADLSGHGVLDGDTCRDLRQGVLRLIVEPGSEALLAILPAAAPEMRSGSGARADLGLP